MTQLQNDYWKTQAALQDAQTRERDAATRRYEAETNRKTLDHVKMGGLSLSDYDQYWNNLKKAELNAADVQRFKDEMAGFQSFANGLFGNQGLFGGATNIAKLFG